MEVVQKFEDLLYKIARNRLADHLRKINADKRDVKITDHLDDPINPGAPEGNTIGDTIAGAQEQPLEVLVNEEQRESMQEWMKDLPPKDRAIVTLRCLNEWPIAEIAAAFDMKGDAVKKRLERAREKLKVKREKYERG